MQQKTKYGLSVTVIGAVLFILFLTLLSNVGKAENMPNSFSLIDGVQSYLFVFAWGMGGIGVLLSISLPILLLVGFYYFGTWVYNRKHEQI